MSLFNAIRSLLLTAVQTAIVRPSTDITNIDAADIAKPLIAYTQIGSEGLNSDSGPSTLQQVDLQLDIFTSTLAAAETAAAAITSTINGFSDTVETVRIHRIIVDDEQFAAGDKQPGANARPVRYVVRFRAWYYRA